MTCNQRPYNHFVTLDPDKDREAEISAAVEADSEKGQELIEDGWQAQKREYEKALRKIEQFFEDNEDYSELIDGSHDGLVRHHMFNLGCYRGFPIFFYDHDGQGVRTKEHLDRVLEASNSGEQKVWVVPAQVHF